MFIELLMLAHGHRVNVTSHTHWSMAGFSGVKGLKKEACVSPHDQSQSVGIRHDSCPAGRLNSLATLSRMMA